MIRELAVLQLRPTRVMQEVTRDERHVEVARLAYRLAVIERFEHRKEPAMPLHHASERIQMPRAPLAAER